MARAEDIPTQQLQLESLGAEPLVHGYVLKVMRKGQDPVEHTVTQARLAVGSMRGNDLLVDDEAVSRLHFELLAEETGVRLRDLGSSNGTYVDGYRVYDCFLRPGARIRAGNTELVLSPASALVPSAVSDRESFGPIIGKSKAMRELYALLDQVAATQITVLIQGESGTGKEVIAEAIHQASPRSGGPLVVFDCSAVPANLMESELFGHEKGAFTGADSRRIGCLEEAHGGTLLLDEIGELPLELQPKLLRAVERREVRPVGSAKSHEVDVRVLAATNRDLSREVNTGAFRHDLYYRLAVMVLRVPPLRERLEDVPLLVEHFAKRSMTPGPGLDALLASFARDSYARFYRRPWNGNVRELRNVVEQSIILGPTDALPPADDWELDEATERSSPDELEDILAAPTVLPTFSSVSFPIDTRRPLLDLRKEVLESFERAYLKEILEQCGRNMSRASATAGMDRSYFKRLIKKYGL